MPRNCFLDRSWGRAGQLLVNFFPLSLVTVPEVFAKVYSDQIPCRVTKLANGRRTSTL